MLRSSRPGLTIQMRRFSSIPLMLLLLLPFVSAFWSADAADSSLPACCRRDGKHHCSMGDSLSADSKGFGLIREKCPFSPAPPSIITPPSYAPGIAAAVFAGVVSHASVAPQVDAWQRVSRDRSRQKRGPPSLVA